MQKECEDVSSMPSQTSMFKLNDDDAPRLSDVSDFCVAEDGSFFFSQLPYCGSHVDICLLPHPLADTSDKTHDDWRNYSRENKENIVVPDSEILYQVMRRLYHLKENTETKKCVGYLRQNQKYNTHTGTKIMYGYGLNATINHLKLDGNVQTREVVIPKFTQYEYDCSYLVLAETQAKVELGTVKTLPENAKPVLEGLLGEGYEEVGAVLQYMNPCNDVNLCRVYLWVPTQQNRALNPEQAVMFGGGGGDWFNISANVNINIGRPALRVVYTGAKKISVGDEWRFYPS